MHNGHCALDLHLGQTEAEQWTQLRDRTSDTLRPRRSNTYLSRCAASERELHLEAVSRRSFIAVSTAAVLRLAQPGPASATTTEQTRAVYQKAARTYDNLDNSLLAKAVGFEDLRRQLLSSAHGNVLEIAVGTGINLPLYPFSNIMQYTGLDLSTEMLGQLLTTATPLDDLVQASRKLSQTPLAARASLVQGDVARLPFEDASFDSVVSTFSLCVFPDPLQSLREVRRVLKPQGQALLLEHSRSSLGPIAWYQDFTADAVASLSKGCVWNQDVLDLARHAGLRLVNTKQEYGGLITTLTAAV